MARQPPKTHAPARSDPADTPAETPPVLDRLKLGLWSYPLLAIIVASAGLLAAAGLVWLQLVFSGNKTHETAMHGARAELIAATVGSRIATLRRQVEALASAPMTVGALASLDQERIAAASQNLTKLMAYTERIEIIPRGRAEVDLNAAVPISFAALDVIKRAEGQPFVGPEAAQFNQRSLVYAAAPITSQGAVAGVLFVALSMDYFADPLRALGTAMGTVTIEQQFPNAPATTILQVGDTLGASEPIRVPLADSNWRTVFAPNGDTVAPVLGVLGAVPPFAVALGLLLAGVYLSYSRLFRNLEADGATLLDYVTRLLRGRGGNLDEYRVPMFKQLAVAASRFARMAPEPSPSPAKPVRTQAPAKKPVGPPAKARAKVRSEEFLEVASGDPPEHASGENFGIEVTEQASPVGLELDAEMFRAYDIRGIVGKGLTDEVVYWIGRAFAAEAVAKNQRRVVVGHDGRLSSPELKSAVCRGLTEGGVDVLDIGMVPTPLMYFATHAFDTGTGVMITGSHNPPQYNGLKFMLAGDTLAEERIQRLRERIERHELSEGKGEIERVDIIDQYIGRVVDDVAVALPLKVVVDCGNGVAGAVAPRLLGELGCDVVQLYCAVDGNFPNHHPDPNVAENLHDLITVVQAEKADLGLAFDGDGDRLGVVTNTGDIVWPDKLLMLFARDIVGRNPGADIIFDVKCSRHLNALVGEYGGRPIMWKTGHSHMKAKLKETGALLAGEFSGHICFGERWYGFDDALYSAARLLEIVGSEARRVDDLFSEFPVTFNTPELKVQTTESAKFQVVQRLAKEGKFGDGTLTTIDGVRVDYPDGWGLVRASNTSPVLTVRFEADTENALNRIQRLFQTQLQRIDPKLVLPSP